MSNEYLVIYEFPEGAQDWEAWFPDLPGCVAVGDDPDPIPPPSAQVGLVRVAA